MFLCLHYGVLVLQLTDDTVILAVAKAKRDDTGKYTVTLKNPSGVETSTVNVNVLGELTDFFFLFMDKSRCLILPCTHQKHNKAHSAHTVNTQGKYTCTQHTG